MPTLFNPADVNELVNRINKLTPDAQRQWGKMNVSQMLAHSNKGMESARGIHHIPRALIGRILGPMFRSMALGDKPFAKNSPTDKSLIFNGEYDFEEEKSKLIIHIQEFMSGGADGCSKEPHAFFGHFTPDQWAYFQWKHLDHHLRQFGV
jgi:hypothetical protein